jgi:hypothetical protein
MFAGEHISISSSGARLSSGPDSNLFLTNTHAAGLFEVDSAGRARLISTLVGLPKDLSPAVPIAENRVMLFAADADEITPTVESRTDAASVDTTFPAVLILDQGKISAIPKERITARPALPVYALRLREIAAEPAGTFIVFDAASGELMRMKLSP